MGARFKEGTCVCLCLIHTILQQKPTQRCKAISLQLNFKQTKKNQPGGKNLVLPQCPGEADCSKHSDFIQVRMSVKPPETRVGLCRGIQGTQMNWEPLICTEMTAEAAEAKDGAERNV